MFTLTVQNDSIRRKNKAFHRQHQFTGSAYLSDAGLHSAENIQYNTQYYHFSSLWLNVSRKTVPKLEYFNDY